MSIKTLYLDFCINSGLSNRKCNLLLIAKPMAVPNTTSVPVRQPEEGRTLASIAFERLRMDIVSGQFQPGQKLPFEKLKRQYDIGVIPLREALSRLVDRRLVTAIGQRGFRVAQASASDITDIAMVRKEIEGLALTMSIELGDDGWESELVASRHRLALLEHRSYKEPVNKDEWEKRHRQFHMALISACRSPWLLHISSLVNDQFDRYRRMVVTDSLFGRPTSLAHQKIMDAALKRDAERARKLLCEHIEEARKLIVTNGTGLVDR